MTTYWLITEPARSTTVRLDVPKGQWADDVLEAYATQYHADDLIDYKAEEKACLASGEYCGSLASYLTDATGDSFELIEETRHIATAEDNADDSDEDPDADAAVAMLTTLRHTAEWIAKTIPSTTFAPRAMIRAAIEQAEKAGIK